MDASDNVYVADYANHAIRKVAPDGSTTTLTGQPTLYGAIPGLFGSATLYQPSGLVVTPEGDLLITTANGIMQATAP